MSPVLTLDGPSGVGKSSVALQLADALGWHYLNSGALYRLLALKITQLGDAIAVEQNVERIAAIAQTLDIRFQGQDIYLEEQQVTTQIRTETIGLLAAQYSAIAKVRAALLHRQRAFARAPGLVTDGRDMGSVVFPQATLKFYLDAAAEIRAHRRQAQLKAQGINVTFADLLLDIQRRDQQDRSRSVAPLVVPQGAVVIDTGHLTQYQVFAAIAEEVRQHCTMGGI